MAVCMSVCMESSNPLYKGTPPCLHNPGAKCKFKLFLHGLVLVCSASRWEDLVGVYVCVCVCVCVCVFVCV